MGVIWLAFSCSMYARRKQKSRQGKERRPDRVPAAGIRRLVVLMEQQKMWGGRFEQTLNEDAAAFQASIGFDKRLYREDIAGSIAHAAMLSAQGILSEVEGTQIINGLREILAELETGQAELSEADEDIHMNIERLLTRKIGDVGKKLHTGRSRNDQVSTDMRLFMMKTCDDTVSRLVELCTVLVELAEQHVHTIMSGYTHLQKAQPTTLAHYLLAYYEMFRRDISRIMDCRNRTAVSPLGSGALCGTTYPLDRAQTAHDLGFSEISRNSMDAVSDRDFIIEYLSCASIAMMHLSRLCEELVLYSTSEFGLIELSDAFATGSSIMPQKKNPDMAELIRGKTGRVYGDLMAMLTVMKGLPLAYNKDLQEDKEGVFDAIDTLLNCLHIMAAMLRTAAIRRDAMAESARGGFTNATEVADYLVRAGMPFRDAHAVSGAIVNHCTHADKRIEELTLDEMREFSPLFREDIYSVITPEAAVEARALPGGPAPSATQAHIAEAKAFLSSLSC